MNSALIILDGEEPPAELLDECWKKTCYRVCVDGAAAILKKHRYQPDIILGDLDSIDIDTMKTYKAVPILKIPDQSTTDAEKAILHCQEKGIKELIILGALGKRTDHGLYNIGLLKNALINGLSAKIYTANEKIQLIRQKTIFREHFGTVISLIPVFGIVENITTHGLEYPVVNRSMIFGEFCSISNRFIENEASVDLTSGYLLVLIGRKPQA